MTWQVKVRGAAAIGGRYQRAQRLVQDLRGFLTNRLFCTAPLQTGDKTCAVHGRVLVSGLERHSH